MNNLQSINQYSNNFFNYKNKNIQLLPGFWQKRISMLGNSALEYQFYQYLRTGTIENFILLLNNSNTNSEKVMNELFNFTGRSHGIRRGFFYSDSDLYKWAEAAAYLIVTSKDFNNIQILGKKLLNVLNELWRIFLQVQDKDGYIFTYNQFFFPGRRWKNLQIEHELYCMGHFIEAGIAYFNAIEYLERNRIGKNDNEKNEIEKDNAKDVDLGLKKTELKNLKEKVLLGIKKTANLIIKDLTPINPKKTPGHQEIEIALLKLYEFTKNDKYLNLSEQFLKERGNIKFFGFHFFKQFLNQAKKMKKINKITEEHYKLKNKENLLEIEDLRENLTDREAPFLLFRVVRDFFTGRYNQQHIEYTKWKKPVGHAVRWEYQVTAITMLNLYKKNKEEIEQIFRLWEYQLKKQLFITGGLGSIAMIEGFGKDYERNGEYAYCETCASIGNLFWNWALIQINKDDNKENTAKYADLIEWQLYNNIHAGISLDGKKYNYRNKLKIDKPTERRNWYATPCCPSNIARTWAQLPNLIFDEKGNKLTIYQYIAFVKIEQKNNTIRNNKIDENRKDTKIYAKRIKRMKFKTKLPWNGDSTLYIELFNINNNNKPRNDISEKNDFLIYLRQPHWGQIITDKISIEKINKWEDDEEKLEDSISIKNKEKTDINQNIKNKIEIPNKKFKRVIDLPFSESKFIELRLEDDGIYKISFTVEPFLILHEANPNVKNLKNKIAFSWGPLLYCTEQTFNPKKNTDISLEKRSENKSRNILVEKPFRYRRKINKGYSKPNKTSRIEKIELIWGNLTGAKLGDVYLMKIKYEKDRRQELNLKKREELTLIPYFYWGNRGISRMKIWIPKTID